MGKLTIPSARYSIYWTFKLRNRRLIHQTVLLTLLYTLKN